MIASYVLPGNHDVASGLFPGNPNRYEKFLRYIRGAGYVTPWLSGIDKTPVSKSDAQRHIVTVDNLQIIAIDTSGYSQVRLDVAISDASWAKLEDVLVGNPQEQRALQGLRMADAARVSEDQLEAIRAIVKLTTAPGKVPLRIAAIHHHLLPVSTKEEIKTFESMTNLGLVRQFLRDQEIAIVLHGHKHTEFTYIDYISSYDRALGVPCPVRVISGASATGDALDRADVFRLLDIEPESGLLQLRRVSAAVPGIDVLITGAESLGFARPGVAQVFHTRKCTFVGGDQVDDVYPQLAATVANQGPESEHVICQVGNSPEMAQLAALYPGLVPAAKIFSGDVEPEIAKAQRIEQFQNIVQWWQYASVPLGPLDTPTFTHGSRIRRYEGHLDQVASVMKALVADSATSRGIAVLLNPPADRISDRDVPFPSFCLVQFKVQRVDGTPPRLDCTAYFRKQEVRFWWLVNLAELAELQREICEALQQRSDAPRLRGIHPGTITTIAARAHAGESAPKVQVPLIDRCYSLGRERLFGMVNALVWDGMPNREHYAEEWLRLFSELHPPEKPDPDGLAIAQVGIEYLKNELGHHPSAAVGQNGSLNELYGALERLLSANQGFALAQQRQEATSDKYKSWRDTVKPLIERIIELSYGTITASKQKMA